MGKDLIVVDRTDALLPVQVRTAGKKASRRFLEFFTANIRNANTRAAYVRSVADFFRWCERMGLHELASVEPVHVAGYIEQLGTIRSAPTVKQHLAAVRMLFDWLVVGQVVPSNPASVVRGPSHVVKRGKIIFTGYGTIYSTVTCVSCRAASNAPLSALTWMVLGFSRVYPQSQHTGDSLEP
jgi:hypothetical protein